MDGTRDSWSRRAWAVVIAAGLLLAAVAPPAIADKPLDIDITAHRGAALMAPENTAAGYAFAQRARATFIEVDVQLSADGIPVLFHDAELTRTTNVAQVFPDRTSYAVGDFTWDELQQLDAGSWFDDDFAGEHIPRLSDAIHYGIRGSGVNIELKDPENSPGVEQAVADELASDRRWQALERRGRLVVSSFDIPSLATFHELVPDVPTSGIGSVPDAATLTDYAAWMATWTTNYREMAPEDVDRVHAAGMELVVYTVDSPDHMADVIDLGVDGIVTDVPQVLRRITYGRDPLPEANGLVVSEIVANVPGSDLQPETGEDVVLTNTTGAPVDVDGYYLIDAVANRLIVGPGYVIPPGGSLRVFTGPGTNTADRYYNDFGDNVLNNGGESVALYTADRVLIDLAASYAQ